jgi:hypothetical protein
LATAIALAAVVFVLWQNLNVFNILSPPPPIPTISQPVHLQHFEVAQCA